jgi:NitT/TauT family transport system substrate-binding protein
MMALQDYVAKNPTIVQGMADAFEEGAQYTYAHPDEAKRVARAQFPDLDPKVVDAAIQRLIDNNVPAKTFVTGQQGWTSLMSVGASLGNCSCNIPFDQIIDNSFAQKAADGVKAAK